MALFYLVRHGQPDYAGLSERGLYGFGRDFAPLCDEGIRQADAAAADARLQDAEIIVSSPYTRALQTAQIISRKTGIGVAVELDLHEWIPDLTNRYASSEEAFALGEEFSRHRGVYPEGRSMRWESLDSMRQRVRTVADRYADRDKVILVGHGMAFRTLAYIEKMHPGEIVECRYEAGQPDCVYSFY